MNLYDLTGFLIHRADVKLTNYFTRKLSPYGVTPEQWSVISFLDGEKGMTQKELATLIDRDQTTLVRTIQLLIKKGIVKREVNVADRRSYFLFLTEKGADLKVTLLPIVKEAHETVTKPLSAEEAEQLKALLNKLYDHIRE